jgi:hypothetical protein
VTATFASETASGWQQVKFTDPVAVTGGTTYVASYHAPAGGYAFTSFGLQNQVDNAPLHALASTSSAGNGLYVYASGTTFPTQTFNATNYWVDVLYDTRFVDTVPPTVTARTPASGATGVPFGTTASATFSKAVQASTISFSLTPSGGSAVSGTVSYSSSTMTATFQPSSNLAQGVTYAASVSGATDNFGNVMSPTSWTFTTMSCPCSVFSSTSTPGTPNTNDSSAIEVGMKFRSDVAGSITGARFYKGSQNTGTHTAHLWSSSGQLLATATFSNETASGWQQVTFSTPVQISANTTYVISYHTDVGFYSSNSGYFNSSADNWPLHGLASGTDGPNGVYVYGASAFPTSSFNASNYWVDVVFTSP